MSRASIKRLNIEWGRVAFALLVALTGFTSVAEATYSLPAERSITWQGNVGVQNDIPFRSTIYKTLSPSGGNDSSAIQTAITACPAGQVVKLNAGTFNLGSSIKLKSGVTLRGAGMGLTILKGAAGMTGNSVIGTSGSSLGTSFTITAGYQKGSRTITTASAHGWSVGDLVLIDQLNNAAADPIISSLGEGGTCTWCGRGSGARSLGQVAKVVAVPSATTATFEIPLYWNYDPSRSLQATKLNGITTSAGIEEFTIDNSASGSSNQAGDNGTISFNGASNCWLLRVESIGSWQNMVFLKAAYRNTIRSGKFHEGLPATPTTGSQYGGRAYGVRMTPYASANLIENNQLWHLGMAVVMNGATSGNVVAYNYIDTLYDPSSNWNKTAISFHGAHPVMNLVEGNYIHGKLAADWYWGSASHNTYFRNRTNILAGKTSATWATDIQKNVRYFNYIGNVFGTVGVENAYELITSNLTGQKAIYRLGYTGDGDTGGSGNDPLVAGTILRHGNWDSVTNGVNWNGNDDNDLPDSLYLTQKPSWWGTGPWPAIGPDLSPKAPAEVPMGSGTPWGDRKTSYATLSAPTGLTLQ